MITVREIQDTVAANFRCDPGEIRSRTRMWDVSHPRQVAMYLSRELTKHSLPRIAMFFNRDHTTVLHGIRAVKKRISVDEELARKIESIRWVLRENDMERQLKSFADVIRSQMIFPQFPQPEPHQDLIGESRDAKIAA